MEVRHYLTPKGVDPFQAWLDGLKDLKGRTSILRRVDRLAAGQFGDRKFVGGGVFELRIDFGPGYRVYYGQDGKTAVLLLCGGSKRTQAGDIKQAVAYWTEYQGRGS